MADTVTMPKLGFDMAEGTLVRWVVPEGSQVEKGAVLAEIETDKATVEVESAYQGTMLRHLIPEGEVVPVGTPIAVIGQPGENVEAEKPSPQEVTQASMESGTDVAVPTGQLTGEEQEQAPGMVGGVAPKGQQPSRETLSPEQQVVEQAEEQAPEISRFPQGVSASPVARHMAAENHIDLRRIHGTGPGGRVVKKDVEDYLQKVPVAQPPPAPVAAPEAPSPAEAKPARQAAAPPIPAFAPAGAPQPDQSVPLSRLRGAIGRRMAQAKQQIPHFYVTHEYDMAAIMQIRSQVNGMLPAGEKLSVNDFLVKGVALALRQYPNLNASLNGDQVIHHGQVNIGVAVAVEGGLLTVVCRDAGRKPLRQISSEVRTMADRARQGKVRPEDIEGSTFSISNLGMYDVEDFVAIINPPEAAILAIGSVKEVPVVVDGEIKPGQRMKATISIDHRISDGAEAARFLQDLALYLEKPMILMV